jgi:hypothetical protein
VSASCSESLEIDTIKHYSVNILIGKNSSMKREIFIKSNKVIFPVHVIEAYRGRRGIAPLILNLNAR